MKKILFALSFLAVFAGGIGLGNHYKLPIPANNNKPSSPITITITKNKPDHTYNISTKSKSFFLRDKDGNLVPIQIDKKRYFKSGENIYSYKRTIKTYHTALIVMDPWEDSGSTFLNDYFSVIYKTKVLPLVNKAININIPVIILTNDPQKNYADYGSNIFPELRLLADKGKVKIIYHQDYDDVSFSKLLKDNSIDTLIYSGFASNACVIGRALGMIPMQTHGFKLYFVPDASAAVEFKDSWKTGAAHKATTQMISQWLGELIDFNEFIKITPT